MSAALRLLVLLVLVAIGTGAAWASYTGLGVHTLGTTAAQMRSGSVGGPRVIGGGPGVGK